MTSDGLSPTSYAILGQLALRSWSVYEMTQNMGRTLHWFWPRAESVLYAEVKRLAARRLARARSVPGRRGRDATIYSITGAGKRALRDWLAVEPGGSSLHSEPVLRVHLSPWGTKDDLVRAIERTRDDAVALLRVGITVGLEFVEERHQFQDQAHIRAILFDYLWSQAMTAYLWADRSLDEVARWRDIESSPASIARGLELMQRALEAAPRVDVS